MHDTSQHFQRAARLFDTSRYDQAEQELRMALTANPDDSAAHALLAMCMAEQQKYREATTEGELAVHLEPDSPFAHFAMAQVHWKCNRLPEAAAAIEEALRLDPYDAGYYNLLAGIRYRQENWKAALAAADEGLKIAPEHDGCVNFRAMALVKLGHKNEAQAVLQGVLARDPENAYSHANQGWTSLEKGDTKQALEHFREALRIDPTLPHARSGMIEALKSRYFFYRWMLAYFLWMAKLSSQARWGVLIGGYLGYRVVIEISQANPQLAPWLQPLIVLYVAFALMTWVSSPLMNLVLRLNRFGRYLLSRGEIVTSTFVGICVAAAIVALVIYFGLGDFRAVWAALVFALYIPPIAAVHYCEKGWPRNAMLLVTAGVVVLGQLFLAISWLGPMMEGMTVERIASLVSTISMLFILAALGSQFAANYLSSVEVRR